ncbi:hypothetical protein [Streptomyces sp. WMMC500]|uniref:hypothetical protein n=1 Tax=Streptomyces sp. WMMC500 TaxID=3015154 RepID=UPI0032B1DD05
MPRRRASTGALAIAALLLLTACGGSDNEDGDDKITGSKPSSTPSEPPTEAEASGRPEIKLPDDAKNVFEDTETGDPKKDAVLADNAERINSIDDAIFQGKEETEGLRFYSSGVALASAAEFIRGWVEVGDTWVGVTRYFDREVTFRDDGAAAVLYCADESEAFVKDGKTGEVDRSPATKDAYVFYNTRLEKNDKGVWQTVNVLSERGAQQCQP